MDILAAQLFLGDLQPAARLDHRRTTDEELAGLFDHHVEVPVGSDHRRRSRDRAEHDIHDRHMPEQVVDAGAATDLGSHDIGAAKLFEVLDAAARRIEQADVGNPIHVGVSLRPAAFRPDHAVG